jgi:hypothetical protein
VRFELPMHFDADAHGITFGNATLDGGTGLEDGFGFVRETRAAAVPASGQIALTSERDGRVARAWVSASANARLFHARAPGQPASTARAFYVLRCEGTRESIRSVWAWSRRVDSVEFTSDKIAVALGAERHLHWRASEFWQMELTVNGAQSGIELYGWSPPVAADPGAPPSGKASSRPVALAREMHMTFDLGEPHYRRSDCTWAEAGKPSAHVVISHDGRALHISAAIRTPSPVFVATGATNPYDNEHPDINGHGVQVYLRTPDGSGAWLIVPDSTSARTRTRAIEGWGSLPTAGSSWERTPDGLTVHVTIPLPGTGTPEAYPIALDVIVNESAKGRERRRGQLVLSGAEDEWVYLRGDRHDAERLIDFLLTR